MKKNNLSLIYIKDLRYILSYGQSTGFWGYVLFNRLLVTTSVSSFSFISLLRILCCMQKLEDALIDAKKLSSHRLKQLTKVIIIFFSWMEVILLEHYLDNLLHSVIDLQLYRCFMRVKQSSDRLRSCEEELQVSLFNI